MTDKLQPLLKTVSGEPATIGYGTGTAWKDIIRGDPGNEEERKNFISKIVYAIKSGFNHLDTAEAYTTQPELGDAIQESGVDRKKLFVTTKYSISSKFIKKKFNTPTGFIDNALLELKTDYIDLFLIHSPFDENKENSLEDIWKEFIAIKKSGKVRHIGVSNFATQHLERIIAVSGDKKHEPLVNQIEFHPYLQEQSPGVIEFSKKHDILIQAYAPLTPLFRIIDGDGNEIKDHPLKKVLPGLAEKYKTTEAVVLLRYVLQKGHLPLSTSSNEERIRQILDADKIELKSEDVKLIDTEGEKFPYRAFGSAAALKAFAK